MNENNKKRLSVLPDTVSGDNNVTKENTIEDEKDDEEEAQHLWKIGVSLGGLRGRIEKKHMKRLVIENNADFLCIQETKIETVERKICAMLWGDENFEWAFKEAKKITAQIDEINALNVIEDGRELSVGKVEQRRLATAEMWRLSKIKDNFLHQQSRVRWIKEGDCNSKFFHAVVEKNRKKIKIPGLKINNQWVEDRDKMKVYIRDFFEQNFKDDNWNRPVLQKRTISGSRRHLKKRRLNQLFGNTAGREAYNLM
ncbi:hypothetical protein RIF29_27586 [Crotalaria pallida]|uniref:RNA-directed DNA polymerase (Reverse transcriptase) n=1 Tax=Crotalaria pallida TaxID=3830 RepID=A0AAN9I0K8_CROPI